MKRTIIALSFFALAFVSRAFAADAIPVKTPAAPAPVVCQSSADCSGLYANFALLNDNVNFVANGVSNASNNFGIMAGGGYQLWKGQLLAGVQLNGGYEFASQGNSVPGSHFLGTALVQLGYNFFPSSAASPTVSGQSPFSGLTLSNFWAASTPYFDAGGCMRHGIVQGCAGFGMQTVVAAGWSTAADYVNMPSSRGQPDNQIFMLKVMKHFNTF